MKPVERYWEWMQQCKLVFLWRRKGIIYIPIYSFNVLKKMVCINRINVKHFRNIYFIKRENLPPFHLGIWVNLLNVDGKKSRERLIIILKLIWVVSNERKKNQNLNPMSLVYLNRPTVILIFIIIIVKAYWNTCVLISTVVV